MSPQALATKERNVLVFCSDQTATMAAPLTYAWFSVRGFAKIELLPFRNYDHFIRSNSIITFNTLGPVRDELAGWKWGNSNLPCF